MKQYRGIAVNIVWLGVVLANTGVLHAIHLLPFDDHRSTSERLHPRWEQRTLGGHDARTCVVCLQSMAVRKVLLGSVRPVSFSTDITIEPVVAAIHPLRATSLSSLSARAPPSICL